ncbi:histidinol dehydrogenase [Rhodovibrio salinarum]|uniref:Histidinol dehydrogenase n=1 Tax=Rhodovibrio salinarum TaxID=1087 RepID=A0A934QFL6_9PROT|nr:histidinol dehydrogenase [Rhodovibrio salinarum]MBK1696112.1 histidinol dehydrogenase [Rhodovibrio salinarum]
MPHKLDARQADFERAFADFLDVRRAEEADVDRTVQGILADVRARGDAALLDYTAKLDRYETTAAGLKVTHEELEGAVAQCDPDTVEALQLARQRIAAFHEHQKPADLDYTDADGVRMGHRWTPIDAVGLYVPGGTAAYPSSVLMNAVPAKVAGVERVVMVVPAPDGVLNPLVLAAARIAGIDEVYRIGGAQAVAALAYGTETIAPVDKITGPGNAYVASAKKQVFGTVGIDMIAGPSEVLIVADKDNDPAIVAADLLAQSEHDVNAQSILITDDADFGEAVERAVQTHLQRLPRSEIAGESWRRHGAVIQVGQIEEAGRLIDRVAPEHLELQVADPDALLRTFRHAGAIFMGGHAPEVLGDYVAGPNHVLPTGRSARFSSGLSVLDFMKRSSLLQSSPAGFAKIGPAAVALAHAEGLDAHALSVKLRLNEG